MEEVAVVGMLRTANRGMNALRSKLKRRQFSYVLAFTALILSLDAACMSIMWWTGILIANIGSDFSSASPVGRALSSLLSPYGLAGFGYITASFTSFVIGRDARASEADIVNGSRIGQRPRRDLGTAMAARSARVAQLVEKSDLSAAR